MTTWPLDQLLPRWVLASLLSGFRPSGPAASYRRGLLESIRPEIVVH